MVSLHDSGGLRVGQIGIHRRDAEVAEVTQRRISNLRFQITNLCASSAFSAPASVNVPAQQLTMAQASCPDLAHHDDCGLGDFHTDLVLASSRLV